MNTMQSLRRTLALAAVAGLAVTATACPGDDPIVEQPDTTLLLDLDTPGTDEGALLFTIEGPETPAVEAASASHQVFDEDIEEGVVRVAVLGNLAEGTVLIVELPEGADFDDYSIDLEQVADRDNRLRANLSGYALELRPTD